MEAPALSRTEANKVRLALEPGKVYRIRRKAGSRTATHSGLVTSNTGGRIMLKTMAATGRKTDGTPFLKARYLRIETEEIIWVEDESGQQVRKCASCGQIKAVTWQADPFQAEIHEDYTEMWQCDDCDEISRMEI